MSRQGRNATVLVGGSGGAFGEYAYDDDPDDMDDGLATMTSLYLKPDVTFHSSAYDQINMAYILITLKIVGTRFGWIN